MFSILLKLSQFSSIDNKQVFNLKSSNHIQLYSKKYYFLL